MGECVRVIVQEVGLGVGQVGVGVRVHLALQRIQFYLTLLYLVDLVGEGGIGLPQQWGLVGLLLRKHWVI